MNKDLRRIHHLTEDESRLLLLYRLLPQGAKDSFLHLAAMQVDEIEHPNANVVNIGSRTIGN